MTVPDKDPHDQIIDLCNSILETLQRMTVKSEVHAARMRAEETNYKLTRPIESLNYQPPGRQPQRYYGTEAKPVNLQPDKSRPPRQSVYIDGQRIRVGRAG